MAPKLCIRKQQELVCLTQYDLGELELCLRRVDPFAKDSPLKAMPVLAFPSDFFFVLRVLQLLRQALLLNVIIYSQSKMAPCNCAPCSILFVVALS